MSKAWEARQKARRESAPQRGEAIYCDCCHTEVLAVLYTDRLVVKDTRNGQRHVATILLTTLHPTTE